MLYSPYYTGELYIGRDYELSELEKKVISRLEEKLVIHRITNMDQYGNEGFFDLKDPEGEVLLRVDGF